MSKRTRNLVFDDLETKGKRVKVVYDSDTKEERNNQMTEEGYRPGSTSWCTAKESLDQHMVTSLSVVVLDYVGYQICFAADFTWKGLAVNPDGEVVASFHLFNNCGLGSVQAPNRSVDGLVFSEFISHGKCIWGKSKFSNSLRMYYLQCVVWSEQPGQLGAIDNIRVSNDEVYFRHQVSEDVYIRVWDADTGRSKRTICVRSSNDSAQPLDTSGVFDVSDGELFLVDEKRNLLVVMDAHSGTIRRCLPMTSSLKIKKILATKRHILLLTQDGGHLWIKNRQDGRCIELMSDVVDIYGSGEHIYYLNTERKLIYLVC